MASMNCGSDSPWTARQNKKFEVALAVFSQETPGKWQKVAEFVGGKSEEEVKRHYELLVKDVWDIERGHLPLPKYKKASYGSSDAAEA
uniref:SANT domain-containing protein n=1 Tax=Kalanchoe fedtschenkoi TaxID=63787 RepID=A0A7N0ZS10_KALFE